MSWPLVQELKRISLHEGLVDATGKRRSFWDSTAQYAVIEYLCYRAHEKTGYAEVTANEIGTTISKSIYHVRAIFRQLEARCAMTRIGGESPGKKNRFVVHLDKAVFVHKQQATPYSPAITPLIAGDHPPDSPAITPLIAGDHPVPDRSLRRTEDLKNVQEATASPRLPLFPLPPQPQPHERDVAAAAKVRRAKLRDRVTGYARGLLMDPAVGRALLHGEDVDASIGALYSAVKLICQKKRIDGYGEVARAVCISEFFKFKNRDVINGSAPRPRDRARERRQGGRR